MAMKKHENAFSDFIGFIVNGSLMVVLATILLLIYLSFADSINSSFDPEPEPLIGPFPSGMSDDNQEKIVNGIHQGTGMAYDENFEIVRAACTSCHSSKLVTQNRATREGWHQMIEWMQATQGLPDLGKNEPRILDYLAKHYAPKEAGRRANLDIEEIEWYTFSQVY